MKLTKAQEEAVKSKKHLSITASAGSGKTTVLIAKYVKILEDLVNEKSNVLDSEDLSDIVESVVVITFTEKAASELRKRATEAIENKIREAFNEKDFEKLRKFERLRDAMPSAIIGTIHSFCARILREFPITAGVDPNFEILEGAERDQVIDMIIEETVRKFLGSDDEKSKNLLEVIERMRINNFYKFIKKLVSSRELVEKIIYDIYESGGDSENIVKKWGDMIFEYVSNVFMKSGMTRIFASLSKLVFSEDADFISKANEFEMQVEENIEDAYETFNDIARNFILTQKGELRSEVRNALNELPEAEREETLRRLSIIKKVYNDIKDLEISKFKKLERYHCDYVEKTKLIISLYREINREYERYKIQKGYLDFEDLQLKVLQLLKENEEVKNELSSRFRYILIDEYQDTNYLQYEIVKKLINNFSGRTNLCVVGDDKQSIYGFRGSDVGVFEITRKEIKGENVKGEEIYLGESFRLLKGIAAFVNTVFGKIMGERISIYEVEYKPIIVGRDVDDDGVVELLVVKKGDSERIGEKGNNEENIEANFVAQRILKLLEDEGAYVYKDGERKKVEASDIAVLIRNRNVLKPLENAFVKLGIPYIVSSGIGFYQTQEIYDFSNYLKFLVNTNDDVSLVGILRSPFFGISDAEIFKISVYGRGYTFWEKTNDYIKRDKEPTPSEKLKYAVNILLDDLKVAGRMSIPSLIQRIIEKTMYNGSVLPMRRGEQIIANIQKLIDVAREFEMKGLNSLYDFVEQLKFLSEVHLREGQASVQTKVNAVQIMTIHAAKGLEFPVVVLPFLGKKVTPKSNESYNIDIDYGIGLGIKYEINGEGKEKNLPIDAVHELIKRHRTIAEEKRVLYVAMTRARDMLILSGTCSKHDTETYLNWILKALEVEDKIDRISTAQFQTELFFMNGDKKEYKGEVKIYRDPRDFVTQNVSLINKAVDVEIDEDKVFVEPLESKPYGEFITATQLQTFSLCPMKFYLKFRLGLPEHRRESAYKEKFEDISAPPYEDDFRDEILGTVRGKVLHGVLERCRLGMSDEELKKIISLVIHQNGIVNEKKAMVLSDYVFGEVKRILDSELGKKIFSAEEQYTEYRISMKFGDVYLMGRIDKLYKTNEGWEIVDFKTDDIEEKEIPLKKSQYEFQIGVYSYLLSKIYPDQKIFRSFILFTKNPSMPIEITYTCDSLESFKSKIEEMIKQIKEMDLNIGISIPADLKEHCRICGYFSNGKCIGKEI
ncbi:MAG: UvrD-helicase domain-containing protein [Candidatus Kryptonium sp.]|nr:UvrD-helicase domain-containing protein [Candidatus Kryptonium sp.]